jgi:hypothetical protein
LKPALFAALAVLAGCHAPQSPQQQATPTGLEAAAIQAGIIPDPASTDITGLYAREADRVCIVPSATAYRIGVTIDYDDSERCSGSGVVTRDGETLHVSFDAPRSSSGCRCQDRASIAGLALDRLSDSVSEAATLRGPRGKLLCGT